MNTKTKIMIGGAAVAALVAGGAGAAIARGGDDGETPITGSAYDRATAVAIEHLGGGTVTETEVGDEESMYEVEVTLDDGSQVDVQLDVDFNVVGTEADDDSVEDESTDDRD